MTKSIVNAGLVLLSAGRELIRVRDQGRSGRADAGVLSLQGRPTLTRAAHKTGRKLYVEMTFALVNGDVEGLGCEPRRQRLQPLSQWEPVHDFRLGERRACRGILHVVSRANRRHLSTRGRHA